jgi:hypothetical protein
MVRIRFCQLIDRNSSVSIVCNPNPCANGGECLAINNYEYQCNCLAHFPLGGKNCDELIATTTYQSGSLTFDVLFLVLIYFR